MPKTEDDARSLPTGGLPTGGLPIRHTWSESDRFVPCTMVQPLQRVIRHEAAGGAVMLMAAIIALLWANSPWHESYFDFWATPLKIELGNLIHLDHLSLQTWVNDALMTIFFLLVGAEIKREGVHGDLRDLRSVTLPIAAAIGGMIVPAAVYAIVTAGEPGSGGWGIPMATDIAFAVGVVSLLGTRVPLGAKVFLLTLAVADDIGAILVIAVFYTGSIAFGWLAAVVVGFGVILTLRRSDVQALAPYLAVGSFIWLALLESGSTQPSSASGSVSSPRPGPSGRRGAIRPRSAASPIGSSCVQRSSAHPRGVRGERAHHFRGQPAVEVLHEPPLPA
ncbi:MAG: Na+/H+ antiporter NhaA [Acidimicrobiales bacterium]|nr:Na+/H+ antiporter NhaA [Acidimicrobiales bacterium]